jgi:hypothetical protein
MEVLEALRMNEISLREARVQVSNFPVVLVVNRVSG